MAKPVFYIGDENAATEWAAAHLRQYGHTVALYPSSEVTHLLLGSPCKLAESSLTQQLNKLPKTVTIIGGALDIPLLRDYRTMDLLQDEGYLWQNARITAQVAVTLAARQLGAVWDGLPVLILGWGRIGQNLAPLLRGLGAEVTVAARKEVHRAQIEAMGYRAADIYRLDDTLDRMRVIFNTVPFPVLSPRDVALCHRACLKMDLASREGIAGSDVLIARALPGKYAPESSGKLIAHTLLRWMAREDDAL